MNLFDTTKLGGYPLAMDDLRLMQDAYYMGFNAVAIHGVTDIFSDYYTFGEVLETTPGVIQPFFIAKYGQIWKHEGGVVPSIGVGESVWVEFVSQTNPNGTKIFRNATSQDTHTDRFLRLTSSVGSPSSGAELFEDVKIRTWKNVSKNQIYSIGQIMNYSGNISPGVNFDASGLGSGDLLGWALCNGNNGTVDLRAKFVAGTDPNADIEGGFENNGSSTGGESTHVLTADESGLRNHSHGAGTFESTVSIPFEPFFTPTKTDPSAGGTGSDANRFMAGYNSGTVMAPVQHTMSAHTHGITGTSQNAGPSTAVDAHENKPPYVALAYMQWLGITF